MAVNHTGVTSETTTKLVGISQVVERLQITRTAVSKMVARGELTPAQKMPGRFGMYLFHEADIDAIAAKRIADLEAKLQAMRTGGVA